MRAFGFEKEPVFKAMEATSIWGQLISAGASLAGAAMGADAAKDAAKKQYAATKQQIELQRRQQELAQGYLSPYVERGNRADAYLDALLYGEGYYGGAGSDPRYALSKEDVLREQNPDMAQAWDRWESKDKGKPNGHRAVYGDFEGYIRKVRPGALQGAQAALEAGSDGSGGTTITRDAAYRNLQETLPWRFNEEDYAANQDFTDDEIAAWVANAQAEQDKSVDALFSRGGITGQVGATRRGVSSVGEEYARDRAQYEAGRRRADYGAYSTGRLSAYGGYLDRLGGDSSRGYQAGTGIASAGQTYANNAGELLGAGARAQAQGGLDASKAWASGIQGAVGYLSDGFGQMGKKSSGSGYTIPDSYGDYESVSGSIRGYDDYGAPTGYVSTRRKSSGGYSNMYSGLYN